MAVDTRDKRASVIGLDAPHTHVFPNPDGSLANANDRGHMAMKYSGIAADPPADVGGIRLVFKRRRRLLMHRRGN